jgi:endo-1,4-beta-xylanase
LNTEGLNLDHSNNFSASRPIWAKIGQYDANGNLNPNWDPLRDYVRVAYRAAKAADPTVQLFYNDYNSEFMGGRSDEIFRYVRDLKSEGVPIEGMGLETHIGLWAQNRLGDLEANMKRYSDLGLEIHVTEIDVALPVKDLGTGFIPTDPADLNRQASVFGDVATACARNTLCTAILGWGFTYRFSWIPSFFPGMGAATPFDQNYNPTPSWFKLKSIVDAANETNTLKCSVSVQIGNSWKTDTGFSNWLNFYVKATGTQGVNVPWTLRAYNPYYTSVSEYWNWQIRSVNRGTISGVANQSWQGLEPNGTNSVQVGMVVNSLQNSFLPRKITLNGVTCSITNY